MNIDKCLYEYVVSLRRTDDELSIVLANNPALGFFKHNLVKKGSSDNYRLINKISGSICINLY